VNAIAEAVLAAGLDDHEYFAPGLPGAWTGGYYIQQNPLELAALVSMLRGRSVFKSALSIGVAAGGCERFLVESVGIRQLAVVDDGQHWNRWVWDMANRAAVQAKAALAEFVGDSHSDTAKAFLASGRYDLVGIDGDHTEAGVRADWAAVKPLLLPGAVVWFHDIAIDIPGQDGAARLWWELRQRYPVVLETKECLGIGAICVP
jgi:hypothetical protein